GQMKNHSKGRGAPFTAVTGVTGTVRVLAGGLLAAALALSAAAGGEGPKAAPPPPPVKVGQVEQKDVPIYNEWVGTLNGYVNAQIRSRVQGYLISQNYKEGSLVKTGDLLFQV